MCYYGIYTHARVRAHTLTGGTTRQAEGDLRRGRRVAWIDIGGRRCGVVIACGRDQQVDSADLRQNDGATLGYRSDPINTSVPPTVMCACVHACVGVYTWRTCAFLCLPCALLAIVVFYSAVARVFCRIGV